MKKKSIIILFILTLFIIVLTGCNKVDIYDINIIFTSDVHCAIDENIGYSSVKAYKDMLSKTNKYVTLVDTFSLYKLYTILSRSNLWTKYCHKTTDAI